MRLVTIGGDRRMEGVVQAARSAGWEAERVVGMQEYAQADVVVLPWPNSFRDGKLAGAPGQEMATKEDVLAGLKPCRLAVHGSGVAAEELAQADAAMNPGEDEAFVLRNALLTAEGAICRAMQGMERALLGSTCLITGFGRIGRALTDRLCAMGAFVIVCARSEMQMRAAHAIGAHPVPLAQIESAVRAADLVLNTVPARVLGEAALAAIPKEALVLELASAPYGFDLERAKALGVRVSVESGIPGRYAPLDAGQAMFESVMRRLQGGADGRNGVTGG